MNKGINKVILIGHLGGDPELKYTPGGQVVATFSVATKEVWKDKDGNRQECVERHRCVAWNKLTEVATEYLKKGSMAYVEGKLQTRDWTDKEGIKRYIIEIVVRDIQSLNHMSNGVARDIPPPSDEMILPPKQNGEEKLPLN